MRSIRPYPSILFLPVGDGYVKEDERDDYQYGPNYARNHFRFSVRKYFWVGEREKNESLSATDYISSFCAQEKAPENARARVLESSGALRDVAELYARVGQEIGRGSGCPP